jgi:hypothetical protein
MPVTMARAFGAKASALLRMMLMCLLPKMNATGRFVCGGFGRISEEVYSTECYDLGEASYSDLSCSRLRRVTDWK